MESPQESHYLPLQHGWLGWYLLQYVILSNSFQSLQNWKALRLGWLCAFFVLFLLLSIIIDSLVDMESPHRGPVPPCPTWHARHTRTAHDHTLPHLTRPRPQRTPTWRTRSTVTAPPCPIYKEGENNVRILMAKNRNTLYCSSIQDLYNKCARIVAYFSHSNNRLYIRTLPCFHPYYSNSVHPIRPPGGHRPLGRHLPPGWQHPKEVLKANCS